MFEGKTILVVLLIKIPIKLNVNWLTIPKVTLPGATFCDEKALGVRNGDSLMLKPNPLQEKLKKLLEESNFSTQ